jgi:hypothetical protein
MDKSIGLFHATIRPKSPLAFHNATFELRFRRRWQLHFVRTNRAVCAANTVIIYAWNEHDEGGWLVPTRNPVSSSTATNGLPLAR